MKNQLSIFDLMNEEFKIDKPIRLIELFSGYGSQAVGLKRLNANFEHWKICEWAVKSIQAYKDLHMPNDNTDYSKELSIEEVKEYLFKKGISSNYNEPMTMDQIKRLQEDKARTIYNNIQATHNLVNVQETKGVDLEIKDKDKYIYICSYSFPCQDISNAGLGKGFEDTSTRSGMLWEVERILKELKETDELPQICLMENVPQIHNKKNMASFQRWINSLEEMGYSNYWQDLIATDYEIPQTRKRTFMVSILGDYKYEFPKPVPLEKKLKDLLEEVVDEKYYLSEKRIDYICGNAINKELKDHIDRSKTKLNKEIAYTITTKQDRRNGDANFVLDGYGETSIGDFLKIRNANSKGYLEAQDGDGVDISSRMEHHRGTVQKEKAHTLDCTGGEGHGVVVNMRRELCNTLLENDKVEENDIIKINYTTEVINGKKPYHMNNNISPTLTTASNDEFAVAVKDAYTPMEKQLFTEDGNIKRYINSDIVDEFKEGQMATTSFPNGYGPVPRTHNESIALNTIDKPSVKYNLRIRKLTPRECGRLMGLNDEEISLILQHQSDASAYHLFGDSLVTLVFCAIISTMMDNCKPFEKIIEEFYSQISN